MNDAPPKSKQWLLWLLTSTVLAVMAIWLWSKSNKPPTAIQTEMPTTGLTKPSNEQAVADSFIDNSDEGAEEAPVALDELDQLLEQQTHISITGRPIDEASLRANQRQLLEDLKGQKRPINPSTMGPLMALEHAQFGRYLERGEFMLADQLLTEMQASWPDYDYEDMIYQLALAEVNADQ